MFLFHFFVLKYLGVSTHICSYPTQSSNTSGKGSTKTPGFEVVRGIVSLLAVFLHKRK
jgi:hypothetical protein